MTDKVSKADQIRALRERDAEEREARARGRPRDPKSISSRKPWVKAGLSRASWYRNRAEGSE
jgi:hypothetical protein